jgi:hypothetical protein
VRPPNLARVERQHGRAPLESRGEHVVADHTHRRIDVDEPVELRASVRGRKRRVPHRIAVRQGHGHHLAVVESADGELLGDDRNGRPAQAQARNLLLDLP